MDEQLQGILSEQAKHAPGIGINPDVARYLETRHAPAPYVPPPAPEPVKAPVVTLGMKRFFAGAGFGTVCYAIIAAANQGAFTAALAIGGQIASVGVGIGAAWVVIKWCFAWKPSPDSPESSGQQANSKTINISVNVAGENVTVK